MEFLFVFITSLVLASLNQLHVITQWIQNPPDRMFTGIAHYFADYFLYTDLLAQGTSEGMWTAAHFTNEPMARTWIYWFNALLGWLGNLVGLSPFGTYNVSLFFLVITLCLLWYKLTKTLYPTNRFLRLTSWLMILTASSFWANGELLGQFWFSPAPAFNRLGGVPHQVFQTILFLLLILTFTKSLTMWSSIILILLAILSSSANPIQMVLFVGAAAITTAYTLNHRKNFNVSIHQSIFVLGIVTITGALGAWVTSRAFELPILAAAKAWENAQTVSVSLWQFFLSVGPIAFLVPFGIKPYVKKINFLKLLLFSYGALSILTFFSPIPKLLGTTNVRWLHPASFAILGILAAEGIPKKSLLVILYLLLTIPSLSVQVNSRTNPKYNSIIASDLNHVPKPVVVALVWLKLELRGENLVVLTDPSLPYDVLVPTITGLPSFTGHPIHTLYPEIKEKLRRDFFAGKMNPEHMRQFLSDHRIGYILSSRTLPPSTSSFLTETYRNTAVAIYKYDRDISCFSDTCPSKKR